MILAIDPGPEKSAYAIMNNLTISDTGILDNKDVINLIKGAIYPETLSIEMIASYGMPVGKSVFETCVWIGRFVQAWGEDSSVEYVYRKDVKIHLCGSMKAKDSNIRQAIMDKYGSTREKAIGKKNSPGPLFGVSKDMWAAIGVGLTYQGI